ncbi:MAG: RlmE family RNA methyltransferase [Methanomicrobiaceae archaeon]|nr:RlmE family RNA methyltransferase [Methanomicrobiaceae archaeon]
MGNEWRADRYYARAMQEGYRSRAAYKLLEIEKRFSIIRDDDTIVDLGASPGSWLQVARELSGGTIVGVDLSFIAPLERVITIQGDFTETEVRERILDAVGVASVILCDASPKLSGQKSYDQARAMDLAESALNFARRTLKPGGNFVIKAFQGELFDLFLARVKEHFRSVRVYRSRATRRGSAEVYIIAKNFREDHGEA